MTCTDCGRYTAAKKAMAEFLSDRRYGLAAALLLTGVALLALLETGARIGTTAPTTYLAWTSIGLVVAGAGSYLYPWHSRSPYARLLPAALALAAIFGAIYLGGLVESESSSVGLVTAAVLILSYVGFATTPGLALTVSPAVLLVMLCAYLEGNERVSLALPLIAVPAAAAVAEVVAALSDRSLRSSVESRRRLERLRNLEDVLRRFRRPGSLYEAAEQVATASREIFDAPRSTVVLRDTQGGLISITEGDANADDPGGEATQLVIETIAGDDPRMVAASDGQTMLVIPLPANDAPVGAVLVHPVDTVDPAFTMDLAGLFGVQIGIAIEHLFLIDELARATTLDELTGIGNRRHADALKASLGPGDALILLDLDGFKNVNDTRGHAAGDQVLQSLSAHLRRCLRDSDMSARLGGDEFLIVARRAHADPLAVANRVLQGWGRDRRKEDGPITTISAGVALHVENATPDETFERADQALYQAKRQGKNQAQLWAQTAGRI